MTGSDVLARAGGLRAGRTPFVLATVVRAERPTSAKPGDCALVLPDGTIEGFVGGSCAESTVRLHGLRLLAAGESTLLRITPTVDGSDQAAPAEGLVTVGNPCLSGGTLEIFMESVVPPALVHVLGESPVARALVRLGTALDYDVRAIDPSAPIPADTVAVIVASHGAEEPPVLAAALRAGVPYVALVASPRRSAGVLATLDVDDELRARVHAPAGLDISARTPGEIALSIFADLVARRPRPASPAVPTASDVVRGTLTTSQAVRVPLTASTTTPTEATDPVCGMTVAVVPAALSLHHQEADWYFCGSGCRQAFADDPARYSAIELK